jgi:predicted nucleotidyltransferase
MISDELNHSITKRLVDAFAPERIILFGSQARGTADDRSDIDILVICPITGKRRHMMLDMDKALEDLDHAFDILILTPEEFDRDRNIPGTIGRYAQKEGRILYAQPGS